MKPVSLEEKLTGNRFYKCEVINITGSILGHEMIWKWFIYQWWKLLCNLKFNFFRHLQAKLPHSLWIEDIQNINYPVIKIQKFNQANSFLSIYYKNMPQPSSDCLQEVVWSGFVLFTIDLPFFSMNYGQILSRTH